MLAAEPTGDRKASLFLVLERESVLISTQGGTY